MARKDANPGQKEVIAQRRLAAVEYRKAGMPVRAIAAKLGVNHQTICNDIQAVMDQVNEKSVVKGRQLQLIQFERYEALIMAHWTKALRGDGGATDRVRELMKDENVLMGLNQPTKIAPTDPDGEESYDPASLDVEGRADRALALLDLARTRRDRGAAGSKPKGLPE